MFAYSMRKLRYHFMRIMLAMIWVTVNGLKRGEETPELVLRSSRGLQQRKGHPALLVRILDHLIACDHASCLSRPHCGLPACVGGLKPSHPRQLRARVHPSN